MSQESTPWDLAQKHLRSSLDDHSFNNWFAQTRFKSYCEGCLTLTVPSDFFAKWLRDHYQDAISASMKEVCPDFVELQLVSETPVLPAERRPPRDNRYGRSAAEAEPSGGRAKAPSMGRTDSQATFNHKYTFERFVIGSGNRFAHAAARAVAENPGTAYNPLFIHGPSGLGKTHLMQAIGQEILAAHPNTKVVYIPAEQFMHELIEGIKRNSTQRFRQRYRKVDVMLVDDVHSLIKSEATQEEFFHTFNELFDMHHQIVMSSDRNPKEIAGIENRLVTRFQWGLVSDMQPPDMETRVAILTNKAKEENADVAPQIISHIATYVTNNVRELEGALTRAIAYSRLNGRDLTMDDVHHVLRDLVGNRNINLLTADGVMKAVAEHFDVRIQDLKGKRRDRQIAYPRQISMYLCKKLIPSLSLKEIGDTFGGKHHTTVLYASQNISDERDRRKETRDLLDQLEKKLRS